MDMDNNNQDLVVFQGKDGALEIKIDNQKETVWLTQKQIAEIFDKNVRTVSEHIQNIYKDEELEEKQVFRKFRTTALDGKKYNTGFYNLDMIISVGYRINSKTATKFRKWATKTLKQHITQGFTINPKMIKHNTDKFLEAVEKIQELSQNTKQLDKKEVLDLVKVFAKTWFSLEQYDKDSLPKNGSTKTDLSITSSELYKAVANLKKDLIEKNQATELFALEKNTGALEGILGNVFQTAFGEDVYPTLEEKAAHLLYFIVKNHSFNDGNKRTGAFSFVGFLQKAGINFVDVLSPETLTSITLLIAESKPEDKKKMVGLVLLLLNSKIN